MTIPLYDTDAGWQSFEGSTRVRFHAAANQVQLQVSVPDGSGGFKVSTFLMPGALRDTRATTTKWPTGQP